MNLNPLLIPEILSKVLDYVDLITLKASRLVSPFWNNQAGKILSSSYWITPSNDEDNPLGDLQQTLVTSPNPSLFFGRLRLNDYDFPNEVVFNLIQTYGKNLKALEYNYWHNFYSSNEYPPAFCHLLIHQVLTEWCPFLEQLNLAFAFLPIGEKGLVPSLELSGPTNLRNIKLDIYSEIPERFTDFLVQIVAASPKMKILRTSRNVSKVIDRLYQNLTLQHITKNLEKFTWKGDRSPDESNIVPNVQFLTNRLKTLRIKSAHVNLKCFHAMSNTFGSSLKNLELMDCGFNRDAIKFQSELFNIF